MQEISVRPRSLFRHSVAVDAPGRELVWHFCTRRKNIAFGLFRIAPATDSTKQQQPLLRPASIAALPLGSSSSVSLVPPSAATDTHAPARPHAASSPSAATQSSAGPLGADLSLAARNRHSITSGLGTPVLPNGHARPISGNNGSSTANQNITGGLHSALGFGAAPTALTSQSSSSALAALPNATTPLSNQQAGLNSSPTSPQPIRKSGSVTSINSIENTGNGSAKRHQRPRLDDPDLEEIVQITHYESCKATIKGSYLVQEPGTYVLVFDNRFSLNTPKKLYFFVAVRDVEPSSNIVKKEVEGWMLKKGNHAIQGFQRRWVDIDSKGQLTYYKAPGTPSRGTVVLPSAAIRLDHDHLLIDIDSGQSTYHFKVETTDEFVRWIGAIEKFAASQSVMDLVGERNSVGDSGDSGGRASIVMATSMSGYTMSAVDNQRPSQSSIVVPADPELENVQSQIENTIATLKKELAHMKELVDSSKARIDNRSQAKDITLVLGSISDVTAGLITNAVTTETQLDAFHSRLRGQRDRALIAIQQAEAAFVACLNDNNHIRKKFGLNPVSISSFLQNSALFSASGVESPLPADRDTMGSLSSAARGDVFFDAEEGDSDDAVDDDSEYDDEDENENARIIMDEESSPDQVVDVGTALSQTGITNPPPYDASTQMASDAKTTSDTQKQSMSIVRRTKLPAPTYSMQNISIMSILRNNVGKDLSTVAMPIALNEPINLLQKLCEDLEYCELLDAAAVTADPIERLCIVAGFVVSGYASTVYRAARKPFNPLLGETYELIREDKGFKYISEKVSHHPPVMASYAESHHYRYYQDSLLKTKFWGKSMELNNTGTAHLEFPHLGEHYIWNKVTTSMRNLFSPGRYLEHHGTMRITSTQSGHYCELVFKESGYFTSANNEVVGSVHKPDDTKATSLTGRWDHSLSKFHDTTPNNLEVIWRSAPFPTNHEENYGFTLFAIQLNEITADINGLLPTTDTRYRPDQRMYEQGNADAAETEKQRLEHKQRESRKLLEASGTTWTPRFFSLQPDKFSDGGQSWQYSGQYFASRGNFNDPIDLFS